MSILETVLTSLALSGAYDLTKEGAARAFNTLKANHPNLIEKVDEAAARGDDTALRDAITEALEVAAADGHVEIRSALLTAVKSANFDHQRGAILIYGTTISAPALVTGGGAGATGQTLIGSGTVMSSAGTSIKVGHGASIRITGNASIKQS